MGAGLWAVGGGAEGVWVGAGRGAGSCSPLWGDRGPGEMGTPCWKSQLWGTSLIVTWLQGPEKRSQLSGFSLFSTKRKSHNRVKRAPCEPPTFFFSLGF